MKIKKIIVAVIIAALMATQLFAPAVFANVADVENALNELKELSDDNKGLLLQNIWDFAVAKIGDGQAITVEAVYDAIVANLGAVGKGHLIVPQQIPGDGAIGEDSVKILIQKLINNKEIIVHYYNIYEGNITKPVVKQILGLPPDATEGQVYRALLPYSVPVLTMEGGVFVRNGNVSAAIARKLGTNQELFEVLLGDINSKIDEMVVKIESKIGEFGLTRDDVIYALEIYDLYEEDPSNPVVASTSPSNGATGVSTGVSIRITYSKDIFENKETGSTYGNITLKAGSTALAINKSISGNTLTITPQSALAYSTTYTVTIPEGAVTDEVLRPAGGCTFSFTTGSESVYIPPSTPSEGEKPTEPEPPVEPSEEEKEIGDIIAEINEEEIKAATGEELDKLTENLTGNLERAVELIGGIDSPEAALELAKTLIEKSAVMVGKLEESGKALAADAFANTLNNVANAVLKKVATFKVEISTGADVIKGQVKLGDVGAGELVDAGTRKMLKDIVFMAQELTALLENNGVESRVKPVLYVDAVSGAEGASNVDVSVPSGLLMAMEEEGIAEMVVMTDVAAMKIPTGSVKLEKDESVTITTAKLGKEQLSDSVKKAVGDAPVYKLAINVNGKKAELKEKVQVTIPYTPKAGEDTEKITVFYVSEEGKLENVIGVYDEKTGTIVFDAEHFSNYTVKLNDVKFKDVGDKFWAARYIEVMASKGVIKGVGAEMFKPANNVTRAEFVAMIVRAFKLFDEDAENPFKDVKETDWFYPEVVSGAKAGIIKGRPGGIFAPNDKITREEMATIVSNVLIQVLGKKPSEKPADYLKTYVDSDKIANYAKDTVAMSTRYGIFGGRPDGTFAPKDNADRAESSKVIYMLFYMK
ncbi:MAG: S-layer homology domain-containing protein [Firmicutes bacterium]|nr:S-layer homology domain-containing protein [Bacillota bacterium]